MTNEHYDYQVRCTDLINNQADMCNKALITLNSGAIFSYLAFSDGNVDRDIFKFFAWGLTLIIFVYAMNYIHLIYAVLKDIESNDILSHTITLNAILSAVAFLMGIWAFALN